VIPGLGWVEAAILAIVLAPTDAALGQAVVSDRRIPSRIRQGLNVESGLNDGICVPLLLIMLAVAEAEEGTTSAGHAVVVIFEEIGYGIVGGVIAGAVGAVVLRVAVRRGLIQGAWVQIMIVAVAALSYAIAAPLGGSGFIAAYVGGLVFGALRRETGGEVSHLLDEVGELLNGVTFIVFGAVVVGAALTDATWELALYAVLSLTVVRMLPVAVAMVGLGVRRPTVAFMGWFGPRGLASIVFAVIVLDDADLPHTGVILTATALTVALSVLAHGISAPLLTERYVCWHDAASPPTEGVAVHEHPVRWGPRDARQ
jgi:NhaP-type Na+/H+ or K+/H+ antiporter